MVEIMYELKAMSINHRVITCSTETARESKILIGISGSLGNAEDLQVVHYGSIR